MSTETTFAKFLCAKYNIDYNKELVEFRLSYDATDWVVVMKIFLSTIQDKYKLQSEQIFIKNRKREVVLLRQCCMTFAYELCYPQPSLKTIGRYFGNRDHSTVIHAKQTVNDLLSHKSTERERILEYETIFKEIISQQEILKKEIKTDDRIEIIGTNL